MIRRPLFVVPKPVANATIRLFCFPYAGGSAGIYASWAERLAPGVELVTVQLPGRAQRMAEPPHQTMESLVAELDAHASYVADKPCLFFGHSLGSRVAYEFACRLQAAGLPAPLHLIASGGGAPHVMHEGEPIHDLPFADFIAKLAEMNGTPAELLANREFMKLVAPTMRADFRIAYTHVSDKTVLACPVTVLRGTDDSGVKEEHVLPWLELSAAGGRVVLVPGDHFFINERKDEVLDVVDGIVRGCLDDLARRPHARRADAA